MEKSVIYLNLTNGIEALQREKLALHDIYFMRLQSTACEQKRWDFILQDLDYNFYMHLALGYKIIIYDYSSKRKIPRALYQGVEWVKYALNKRWFNKEVKVYIKRSTTKPPINVTNYFAQVYKKLTRRTKQKLDYFKKFLITKSINIEIKSDTTDKDGNYEYYANLLKTAVNMPM